MFRNFLLVFSLVFLSIGIVSAADKDKSFSPAPNTAAPADAYRLNPGDTVLVSVWREDALQKEVRVLPDGSITLPLAGRIEVAGFDSTEAGRRIAAALKDYIPDPAVTVVITTIEGNRAYVLGKVLKPGPVVMIGLTTVLQALSVAGGLDKFADEGSIKVVRHKAGKGEKTDEQEVLPVRYKDLISGRDMSTNLQLKAGDTLLVP
jgi:polysaccharide export outer membrane protein